jgi:hypothetical protein
MFQKIKVSRICDTVVKDIEEAAISGQLKPGDKLPAERVLSESLAFLSHFQKVSLLRLQSSGALCFSYLGNLFCGGKNEKNSMFLVTGNDRICLFHDCLLSSGVNAFCSYFGTTGVRTA